MGTKKKKDFIEDPKEGDFGEIKVLGFRRCSRDLLPFYYASRGRDSSYFGFSSHFCAGFLVKNGGIC